MKNKLLNIVLSGFCLISCNPPKTTVVPTSTGGTVRMESGITVQQRSLEELEYKAHTYVFTHVRDGIALTHAGHCKCNTKK